MPTSSRRGYGTQVGLRLTEPGVKSPPALLPDTSLHGDVRIGEALRFVVSRTCEEIIALPDGEDKAVLPERKQRHMGSGGMCWLHAHRKEPANR